MATMSEMMGIDMLYIVWPLIAVKILVAALGSFLMFYEYKKDYRFAFLGSMIFTLTSRFLIVSSEYRFFSTRGFVLAILPLFFWSIYRYTNKKDRKSLILIIIFTFLIPAVHLLGFFIVIAVVGYILAFYVKSYLMPSYLYLKKNFKTFHYLLLFISGVLLFTSYYITMSSDLFIFHGVIRFSPDSVVAWTTNFPGYILNLTYSYGKFVGALSPLFLIGFPLLFFKPNKTQKDLFVLIALFLFLPMLGALGYVGKFILLLMLIPLTYAAFVILNKGYIIPKKFMVIFLVIIIVAGSCSYFILFSNTERARTARWEHEDPDYEFAEDWYNGGVYLKYVRGDDRYLARTRLIRNRVNSIIGYSHKEMAYVDRFPYENVRLREWDKLMIFPHRPFYVENWEETGFPREPLELWSNPINHTTNQEYLNNGDIRYIGLTHLETYWAFYEASSYYEENPNLYYSTVRSGYNMYQDNYHSFYFI